MAEFIISVLVATAASAQPTLDSLWPNSDGLRFTYDYTYQEFLLNESTSGSAWLQFDGYAITPGGQAQIIEGGQPPLPGKAKAPYPGILGQVWRARPDLRMKIAALYGDAAKDESGFWCSSFLSSGLFLKSADGIRMWNEYWNDTAWVYLDGDILPGASFTVQLLPELAPDFYLHGTVEDVAATIMTGAGTFANAVKVAYRLGIRSWGDARRRRQPTGQDELRNAGLCILCAGRGAGRDASGILSLRHNGLWRSAVSARMGALDRQAAGAADIVPEPGSAADADAHMG
ncbi:MAG: hypothetical protein IPP62_18540 [bacterium]|nr:hypothetical protein [bacterium]